ncbi:MAG: DMT family transporter [Bacteroidales bacterium]|jgi:drug/metabolite transporter (DMT)-like permease|nr:DMT family transporter [Bacteroidales bacterium]
MALLIVLVWGTTFISTKILLLNGLSPENIFFYRFLIAAVGIWFFGKSRWFADSVKDELLLVLLGVCGGSLYFVCENTALNITQTANVALIVCTAPLITAFLSHLMLPSEKLNRFVVQGSLMSLLGVALVAFNGHFVLKISPLGDFLSLMAALTWAIYTIVLKQLSNRYSSLFITRKVFIYGVITILPAFFFHPLGTELSVLLRPAVLGNLLYLGVVASLLCYFFWNILVNRIGAVRTSNYIYIVPLVALIAGVIALNEVITPVAIVGALLILAGVVWAGRKSIKNYELRIKNYD